MIELCFSVIALVIAKLFMVNWLQQKKQEIIVLSSHRPLVFCAETNNIMLCIVFDILYDFVKLGSEIEFSKNVPHLSRKRENVCKDEL